MSIQVKLPHHEVLVVEDYDYTPGTPNTYWHPGDPAEVILREARWEDSGEYLTEEELDQLTDDSVAYGRILEKVSEYEDAQRASEFEDFMSAHNEALDENENDVDDDY